MQQPHYDSEDNDIAIIVGILKGRKLVILSFFFAALALAFAYVSKVSPQYVAMSEILIKSSQNVNARSVLQMMGGGSSVDVADLRSRVEILQSPDFVRLLIKEGGLYGLPEVAGSASYSSFDELSLKRQTIMVAQVKKRLSVKPVLGTSLVDISYRSGDPVVAASVANGLVELYIESESRKKREQSQQISDWLGERLDALREEVKIAEIALEKAIQDGNLPDSGSTDPRLQQISLLGRQLADAEGRYAKAQAKIGHLKTLKNQSSHVDVIADVVQSRVILGYKTEISKLERERSELSQKYGRNHPSMKTVEDQIRVLKRNIQSEINLLVEMVTNEADIADVMRKDLQAKIDEHRADYQADSPKRISIRDLESEATTARALLNSFMASYRESLQSLDFQQPDVTVVSVATPPTAASFPQKSLIVGLCGITGLFLGIFIALVLEKLQNSFQTAAQIEKLTGIPVYGVLAKAKKLKSKNPADFIMEYTATGLAELVRSLYITLKLRDPKKASGGRVVTVTSTLPDEGKTTTAIWLATIAANNGERVLVIDADMRRPSLHKNYDIGNAKGLADYLSDRLPLDDVIYDRHPSGVHVMTSKAIPTHALTLLTSERMEAMIRRMRDMYDLVIIDAPTALVFSDARVVAKLSDKTFYIVEWKKTRRDVLMSSVKNFMDMDYKDLAVILNKAEVEHYKEAKKGGMAYMYQMKEKG